MSDSYEITKQYRKAQLGYQKSLEYEKRPLTYYFLADLYDTKLKDKKSALKYFKKYIAIDPPEEQKAYVAYAQSRIKALNHK
jgi:tetratricopeptide (TPR) repeat protein